jgi:hypothetical protein
MFEAVIGPYCPTMDIFISGCIIPFWQFGAKIGPFSQMLKPIPYENSAPNMELSLIMIWQQKKTPWL